MKSSFSTWATMAAAVAAVAKRTTQPHIAVVVARTAVRNVDSTDTHCSPEWQWRQLLRRQWGHLAPDEVDALVVWVRPLAMRTEHHHLTQTHCYCLRHHHHCCCRLLHWHHQAIQESRQQKHLHHHSHFGVHRFRGPRRPSPMRPHGHCSMKPLRRLHDSSGSPCWLLSALSPNPFRLRSWEWIITSRIRVQNVE